MRVEGLAVAGREGRHPVRLGLALVLEERVEVAVDHFPQNTVHHEELRRSRYWSSLCAASSISLCRHSAARYWQAISPIRCSRLKSP
jgi:hypothetical protein